MEAIIGRKDEVVDRLVSGIEFLMKKNKIKVIVSQASFVNKTTVKVTGSINHLVMAKNIIIATGSKITR